MTDTWTLKNHYSPSPHNER